jgi:hypothetical protein
MMDAEKMSLLLKQFRFLNNKRAFFTFDGRLGANGLFAFEKWHADEMDAFVRKLNEAVAPALSELLAGVVAAIQAEVKA